VRRIPALIRLLLPLLLALPPVACASAGAGPPATAVVANREAVSTLAAGRVESLPTGPVYVRFVGFTQPSGYVINSKQHVPSIVYVETGTHRLTLAGQPPLDLSPGQAAFHQTVTHVHLNPGADVSLWYSIAVWPSSARGQPLVDPIARAAFESADIGAGVLPQVVYSEVLRRVTLTAGGPGITHQFGGLVTFFVLAGSLTIKAAHRTSITLGAHQGTTLLPDVDLQETNVLGEPAVFLEFIATPAGRNFEMPASAPSAR
jgi:hypothetical protein